MHEPKVSVVVPIYNVEKELDTCVQSIIGQTVQDIEIILVDDGSPDACPEMCDAYAAQDPRVTVLHKPNGGLSDARNEGLKIARGTYVLFVDSDDYLSPDACEQLLQGITDEVDLVAAGYTDWNETHSVTKYRDGFDDGAILDNEEFMLLSLQRCFFVQTWAYMYRREFMLEKNLFFKKGLIHEDLEIAPRIFYSADKVMIRNYSFYNHVFREGSIMWSPITPKKIHDNAAALDSWRKLMRKIKNRRLRFWLGHELTFAYLGMCHEKGVVGWWIRGVNFPFAVLHCVCKRELLDVARSEYHFIKARLHGTSPIPRRELRRIIRYKGIYPN